MTAAAVFLLCAVVDALWLGWTKAARDERAGRAAAFSGAIQLVGVVSILLVVDDRNLLFANVAGHAVGSYVGVWLIKSAKIDCAIRQDKVDDSKESECQR